MRLLIATGLYPPEIGGPATFVVQFEKGLQRNNIPYTTIPFSTVRTSPKIIRHIRYFLKVLWSIRHDTIVFALDPVSVGLPALLAAKLKRRPFFLRVGGDYAWEQASQRGFHGTPEAFQTAQKSVSIRILAAIQSFVAGRARKVLVQSTYLAGLVEKWDVPTSNIAVIPNSADPPSVGSKMELRKELGWHSDEHIIVSAGRLVPWKGFSTLIDAAGALPSGNVRLVIAGTGPEEHMLREQAKKARIHVEFSGALSNIELAKRIKAADVFALNTGYEGFSHQILEAMMQGTPVVTTSIGGNTDLVDDGSAFVVPFNNAAALTEALRSSLVDTESASERAHKAAERAVRFTPERTYSETCRALGIAA